MLHKSNVQMIIEQWHLLDWCTFSLYQAYFFLIIRYLKKNKKHLIWYISVAFFINIIAINEYILMYIYFYFII